MNLGQAKKLVMRLRIIAALLFVAALLFFLAAALKSIYFVMASDTSAFSGITQEIQNLIDVVYRHTQGLGASLVWDWAPVVNPRQINTPSNFGFLFIVCCGAAARLMWDSASHLSSRIRRTILRVEEVGWERALLQQQGDVKESEIDILQIKIDLEQKDQWYKRPVGLIIIGVSVALLVQWANLTFGLFVGE